MALLICGAKVVVQSDQGMVLPDAGLQRAFLPCNLAFPHPGTRAGSQPGSLLNVAPSTAKSKRLARIPRSCIAQQHLSREYAAELTFPRAKPVTVLYSLGNWDVGWLEIRPDLDPILLFYQGRETNSQPHPLLNIAFSPPDQGT